MFLTCYVFAGRGLLARGFWLGSYFLRRLLAGDIFPRMLMAGVLARGYWPGPYWPEGYWPEGYYHRTHKNRVRPCQGIGIGAAGEQLYYPETANTDICPSILLYKPTVRSNIFQCFLQCYVELYLFLTTLFEFEINHQSTYRNHDVRSIKLSDLPPLHWFHEKSSLSLNIWTKGSFWSPASEQAIKLVESCESLLCERQKSHFLRQERHLF